MAQLWRDVFNSTVGTGQLTVHGGDGFPLMYPTLAARRLPVSWGSNAAPATQDAERPGRNLVQFCTAATESAQDGGDCAGKWCPDYHFVVGVRAPSSSLPDRPSTKPHLH
jgi:hypothetical protein